jgi:hypothetical protein
VIGSARIFDVGGEDGEEARQTGPEEETAEHHEDHIAADGGREFGEGIHRAS